MYEIFFLNHETNKENTILVYAETTQEATDIFEAYFVGEGLKVTINKIKNYNESEMG